MAIFKITGRNRLCVSHLGDSIIYHPKWNLFKSERRQPFRKPGKQSKLSLSPGKWGKWPIVNTTNV